MKVIWKAVCKFSWPINSTSSENDISSSILSVARRPKCTSCGLKPVLVCVVTFNNDSVWRMYCAHFVCAPRNKKTSLGESLAESHAYNPIRDSGERLGEREKSRQESCLESRRESRLDSWWESRLDTWWDFSRSPRICSARLSPRLVFFMRGVRTHDPKTIGPTLELRVQWGCFTRGGSTKRSAESCLAAIVTSTRGRWIAFHYRTK